MELYTFVWDIFSTSLVFLLGIAISMSVASGFQTSAIRTLVIYSWHTLFCMLYLRYSLNYGSDAIVYYRRALEGVAEFNVGTAGVEYLTALFVQGFNLSILSTFLVFNIFGAIGLLAFDAALRFATWDKKRSIQKLATLIIFIPSVSFWSSAIGKDSLSFMATGLALWAALDLGRRMPLMMLSVVTMLLVRPHMAALMVIALTVAILLNSKFRMSNKILLSVIVIGMSAYLVPFSLQYVGLNGVIDLDILMNYFETLQSYNTMGAGGIDVASMNFPMQLFTYMFRPIIFEAWSLFALAASIDNLILLYLFVAGSRILLVRGKKNYQESRIFMWLYSLMAWVILALTSANLGISIRQKWMFAPMLIFLFISVIGKKRVIIVSKKSLLNANTSVQKNIVGRVNTLKVKGL
jgi:hypothetical protein